MSGARQDILGAVKKALDGLPEGAGRGRGDSVKRRIDGHAANLVPKRGQLGAKARVDLFIREAERVNATVARVSEPAGVPREVARYLAKNNLPTALKVSPEAAEPAIPWNGQALLDVTEGAARGDDPVSVSRAFAGVAETGTLVLLSGARRPTTLNFLPPTNVVIIMAGEIAGDYETVWTRIRAETGEPDGRFMPRTVNWITGPSRTADIEQTLLLGAHGPQRLHIVIVDDQA